MIRLGKQENKDIFSADTLLLPSSEGIISEVGDNPNAIGYDGLGYMTPHVKVVGVATKEGGEYILPSAETVNSGTYPISRDLYMYTNKTVSAAIQAYLDWILSSEAQQIVTELGFVPVKISPNGTGELAMQIDEMKRERPITLLIRISGYSSILFVTLILLFLLREGLPTLGDTPLGSLLGTRWYPIEDLYGILPLLGGSLIVTIGAMLIALPLGIGTAVFIAEVAPPWINNLFKPLIEILGRAAFCGIGIYRHPGAGAVPAPVFGSANRPDGFYRRGSSGADRHPHHRLDC